MNRKNNFVFVQHLSVIRKALYLFAVYFLFANDVYSQCCSPGNPIGGTANVGTVKKGTLRSSTFFRHSIADTYYDKNRKAEVQGTDANFNYLGQTLAYGITPRLTIETEFGYFINKTRTSEITTPEKASGLSNGLASVKYSLWKDNLREWELTIGSGLRFPFSRTLKNSPAGYPLSMDVQPSTGAAGYIAHLFLYKGFLPKGWRFFLVNRFEVNGKNDIGYQYGKANNTSFFISHSLNLHWMAILQLRNEWRDYDHWDEILLANTGGNVLYISPQINLNIRQKWNISILWETPIVRNYHLNQLGSKYAFAINILRDFDLHKKVEVILNK